MNWNTPEAYGDLANHLEHVLIPAERIQEHVQTVGKAISEDYAGRNPLLVGVLKGVLFFMADLLRSITVPVEVDFMAVSSYSPEASSKGLVRLVKDLETPIAGRHVLFVEDMIDTGLTLGYLLRNLEARNPASLHVCALFTKDKLRLIDIPVRYQGIPLPDRFVVGYGLDYRERYRNLPFVATLKPDALNRLSTQ